MLQIGLGADRRLWRVLGRVFLRRQTRSLPSRRSLAWSRSEHSQSPEGPKRSGGGAQRLDGPAGGG